MTGGVQPTPWPEVGICQCPSYFEPALHFEVVDAISGTEEAHRERYIDWTIFGLLDVLMADGPLRNIRIILEEIEIHPIDSYRMAFRNAGRDAGRRFWSLSGSRDRLEPAAFNTAWQSLSATVAAQPKPARFAAASVRSVIGQLPCACLSRVPPSPPYSPGTVTPPRM